MRIMKSGEIRGSRVSHEPPHHTLPAFLNLHSCKKGHVSYVFLFSDFKNLFFSKINFELSDCILKNH